MVKAVPSTLFPLNSADAVEAPEVRSKVSVVVPMTVSLSPSCHFQPISLAGIEALMATVPSSGSVPGSSAFLQAKVIAAIAATAKAAFKMFFFIRPKLIYIGNNYTLYFT